MAEPRNFTVTDDDDGIRLDRWFKRNLPEASFNLVSRWARTGQLRLDGKRATPGDRIEAGQQIRILRRKRCGSAERPKRKVELLTLRKRTELVREMCDLFRTRTRSCSPSRGAGDAGGTKTPHHLDRLLEAGRRRRRPTQRSTADKDTSGACWSRGRRGRRAISPRLLPAAPRARSTGR